MGMGEGSGRWRQMQKGKRKAEHGPRAENQPVPGFKFLVLTSICVPFFLSVSCSRASYMALLKKNHFSANF